MIGVDRTEGARSKMWRYQAFVVLGPNRIRVVEGNLGNNLLQAYENLLGATAEMLARFEFRYVFGSNIPRTTRVGLSGAGAFYTVGS